jgi:IS5 family transposase
LGYDRVKQLGDPLEEIDRLVDWEAFRKYLHQNSSVGRHGYDPIVLLKTLVLQGLYGISDEQIEYQIADRSSFQKFLGFPNSIPDYSTVWRFREELGKKQYTDEIWNELKKQLLEKGITFSKGVIQDARIIHADPGKKNSGKDERGRAANTSRSADGTWTKKGKKSMFGFKMHNKVDTKTKMIMEFAVTTAKVPDGNIDLTNEDEFVYRDKGYFGFNA